MKVTYSYRRRGYIVAGLKALSLIEFRGRSENSTIFHCEKCNKDLTKKKIILHYAMSHRETYDFISTLITAWGLVESLDQWTPVQSQ